MGLGCLILYINKGRFEVRPTWLGKITTVFQMLTILALLFQFKYSVILWNVAILFSVVSGFDYLKKGSKLLTEG